LLACLPFWLLYLDHVVRFGEQATGFLLFDMGYYPANGREVFERGNGIAYCNPYDPDSDAPVIYVHWLQWAYGLGIGILGVDPGVWFVALGIIGGWVTALLTFRIVEEVLPGGGDRGLLYLVVMWGGGCLFLLAVAVNVGLDLPILFEPLRFDPVLGWWCLNWGRNLVLPTEAVYHALVAWAWLATLRSRPWQAVGAVGLLAATHPFSGIQHLLILASWQTLQALASRRVRPPLMALIGILALFLWYYFIYLRRFSQHRAIHDAWSLDWNLPVVSMLAAYLPLGCVAALRIWRDRRALSPQMAFLAVAAVVSFALAHHDRLLPAKQPMHFTRGYVWLPLCLLALPLLQSGLVHLRRGRDRLTFAFVATIFGLLAVSDNAAWLVLVPRDPEGMHGQVRLLPDVRKAFGWLESCRRKGVSLVVVPGAFDSNYLAATYTGLVPFIGHPFLSPDYDERVEAAMLWEQTGEENALFRSIDTLILDRSLLPPTLPFESASWAPIHSNDSITVLERRSP
jgi:hypothetical protein